MSTWAIARLSAADGLRNPATWASTGSAVVLLGVAVVFGMFTFDIEDRVRLLATAGLATSCLHALFISSLLAAGGVRQELESRTALTLFAHPVSRRQWLCGKALGVWLVVAVTLAVLLGVHELVLWAGWRTGFDPGRMEHRFDPDAFLPLGQVLLGHLLVAMQAALFAVLAVVAALRLGFTAALAVLAAMFVAGNAVAAAGLPGLVLIPAMHLYQVDDAVQGFAEPLGLLYLGSVLAHTALACAGWILIGLALFRDRDLP